MRKEQIIALIKNLPLFDVEYESEDALSYVAGQIRFRERLLDEIKKVFQGNVEKNNVVLMEDRALEQYLGRLWEHRIETIIKTVEWKFSEEIPAPVMVRLLRVLRQEDDPTKRSS